MLVMPSNNTAAIVRQLGRLWPNRVGLLMSPAGWRRPSPYLPYALDNAAFAAWRKKEPWDETAFYGLCDKAAKATYKPLWVICPDAVADKDETLRKWDQHYEKLAAYGFPVAFAVQDGMVRQDVPDKAALVFVGGSTKWKWATLGAWAAWFPRVHVGRVNTLPRLMECEERGVESIDGTGWFRGDPMQTRELIQWVVGQHPKNLTLFFNDDEDAEGPPGFLCDECGNPISAIKAGVTD
jgi:hypothetical protein